MYVSFGLMIAGRPSIVSSVPRRIFSICVDERSSSSSITAAVQRGSMNSKSICEARTKRVAWGGTRHSPDSNASSTFAFQSSFNPMGLFFAFSMFSSTTALAERGIRLTKS